MANEFKQLEGQGAGEIGEGETKKHELVVSGAENPTEPLLKSQIISFLSEHQCIDIKQDIFQPDKPYWKK